MPLRPGNPAFLVWIGDIAEFVNAYWGAGSLQSVRLAEVLRGAGAGGNDQKAVQAYLNRLRETDRILADLEAELSAAGGPASSTD
jgi:hypothetical protein